MKAKIGILAIQGAFLEHKTCLTKAIKSIRDNCKDENLEIEILEVREANDMTDLDALIIPGGESTTMGKSLDRNGFKNHIKSWMNQQDRKPVVWGTCAGMILLANNLEGVKDGGQSNLGGLDITVSRNYFGRQINSFEAKIDLKTEKLRTKSESSLNNECLGVFIRAPAVCSCDSDKVIVLGSVQDPKKSDNSVIVAVKQDNLIATAFHPELTDDTRWHEYFLKLVFENKCLQQS